VIGRRVSASILLVCVCSSFALANGLDFFKKPKSESQVRRLTDTARGDADESKRRAAIAELRDADPRSHADVIPTLIAVLQKDASAVVRREAAEAIGSYKLVYPLAGLALEAASELDSTREVRDAAREALWEYHLAGYRSPRGANGIAGQTAEPPIARPQAIHRAPVTPVAGLDIPVPMAMPAVKLPPVVPQPPSKSKPLLDSPIFARRPVLDSINQLKAALPRFRSEAATEPPPTPEPPLAVRPTFEAAPEPRAVSGVPHVVEPQPYQLPTLVEPPVELPPVMKPMLVPQEMPFGPRVKSSR